jgi:hypothetical protein
MPTYYEKMIRELSPFDQSDSTIINKLITVLASSNELILDREAKSIFLSQIHTLLEFIKYGKKVFTLKEDLCYLLNFTDIKEVDSEHIKLPFACFYINGFKCLNFKTSKQNTYAMDSVFVRGYPLNSTTEMIMSTGSQVTLDDVSKQFNIKKEDMVYALEFIFTTEIEGTLDDDYLVFPYVLTKGNALKQITEKCKDNHPVFQVHTAELVEKLLKFVLNCILYINSDEAIIRNITPAPPKTNRKASRSRKPQIKKNKPITYYLVGSNIAIGQKEKETYREACRDKHSKITASWIVRGHWHGYWKLLENISETDRIANQRSSCKSETKALVKKWLQPYIKGNREMEVLHKNYTVGV